MTPPREPFTNMVIPIPLRGGEEVVRLHGLPGDITEAEAVKIAAVIHALALPSRESNDG